MKTKRKSKADDVSTEVKNVSENESHTHEDVSKEAAEQDTPTTSRPDALTKFKTSLKTFRQRYWQNKKLALPLTLAALLAVVALIPFTRYGVLGLFIQRPLTVVVLDSSTNAPVSAGLVTIGDKNATTNNIGEARLMTALGDHAVTVSKRYYRTSQQHVLVGLNESSNTLTIRLLATGRIVTLTLTNKISGQPIANVTVKAHDSEAKSDKSGVAQLVLPLSATSATLTATADGYNKQTATVSISTAQVNASTVGMVPTGRIYFLSNLSGKIDVVSTNLDGSDRKTVLAGSGFENQYSTALLASRDWKYLALFAQRKAKGNPEIDLIETSTGAVSNIDEGNAGFSLIGWSGSHFIYRVDRNSIPIWQNGHQVIKSFDATTKKLTALTQTSASGPSYNYIYQYFGDGYIFGDKIVYALNWSAYYYGYNLLGGRQASLNSINADGTGKATIKSFSMASDATQVGNISLETRPYDGPESLLIRFYNGSSTQYFEYENGKVATASDISDNNFFSSNYPTFLLSPSGNSYFWSEYADGKNNLKIGDGSEQHTKSIASESEFSPYGWFTDNYLLAQKSGSELYIMTPTNTDKPLKVSNYYKPQYSYRGYGGGYGGL